MDDSANELYFVFWCDHSRDSNGVLLCNCLVGALPFSNYVMRSFPLSGAMVLHPAHYDLIDNHHGDRQKKTKKRYPGCLANAMNGLFYGVVANQRQPQYTYNVIQRRCQPRPTTIPGMHILRGGSPYISGCNEQANGADHRQSTDSVRLCC